MAPTWGQAQHFAQGSLGFGGTYRFASAGYALGWSPSFLRSVSLGSGIRTTVLQHDDLEFGVPNAAGMARDLHLQAPPMVHANLAIPLFAEMRLSKKWSVGFNIDVIGITVGKAKTATVTNSTSNQAETLQASPINLSLLIFNTYDRGLLQSEFYASYGFTDKLRGRLGLAHQHLQLNPEQSLLGEDRFTRFVSGILLGAAYSL